MKRYILYNSEDFDDYTFQINGVLTGPNSLAITRKYKFIYPEDNIFLESFI